MNMPVLTVEQLTPVVCRALDVPAARPLEWSCEPLDVDLVNPLTAGLYRVVGTAQVGAGAARAVAGDPEGRPASRLHGDVVGVGIRRAAGGLELLAARGAGLPLRPARALHLAVATRQVLGHRGRRRHDRVALAGGARRHLPASSLVAGGAGRLGLRLGGVLGAGCRHGRGGRGPAVGGAPVVARLGRHGPRPRLRPCHAPTTAAGTIHCCEAGCRRRRAPPAPS